MNSAFFLLGQSYDGAPEGAGIFGVLIGLIFFLIWLAVVVLVVAGTWKAYSKAGKPGWAAIVPIYNMIVLLEIVGRPLWWIVLLLVPFVNVVIALLLLLDVAKSFGKSAGFGLGLFFLGPIFWPILGFGSATYRGPAAGPA